MNWRFQIELIAYGEDSISFSVSLWPQRRSRGVADYRNSFRELWDISGRFSSNSGIDVGTWLGVVFVSPARA
jgi:hypothetical protein